MVAKLLGGGLVAVCYSGGGCGSKTVAREATGYRWREKGGWVCVFFPPRLEMI